MRTTLITSLTSVLVFALLFATTAPHTKAATRSSKTAFPEGISVSDFKNTYTNASANGKKVRVLLVPGHEPSFGGAEFQGFYERELVVALTNELSRELGTDASFEVLVARGNLGWNEDLERYFDRQERKIESFVEDHKEDMEKLERRGRIQENEEQAAHNEARTDVAHRLYGITKWANENNVDLMVHLHLNDELSHPTNERGEHSGVAVYIPDAIYSNARASRTLGESIFAALATTNATSTFGYETKGVLEDRDLIALGAYNTSEVPSVLIEYGYIYEPRFTGAGARAEVFSDMAAQTARGIRSALGLQTSTRYDSKVLPYTFTTDVLATTAASSTPARSVYALQAALHEFGFYPGTTTLTQCPLDGLVSTCTIDAVKAFQKAKGLEETGTLGAQTRAALNTVFGLATTATPPVPVAAGTCTPFTATLEVGATDASTKGEVSRLQKILAADTTIYPEGSVTGYFGPATLAAVKRFQEAKALATKGSSGYGLVGPKTRLALCSTAGN